MDGEEEGGLRLSKRIAKGEVDYSNKAGTAWSHSYLNQKPWHPLSYPNQKRKWIAEQTDAQKQRRAEEVAREFAQEQEFFRQTAAVSKKEKEKVELMQAVSFMYVRPPGYNPESAKAAEIADENKKHATEHPKSVDASAAEGRSSCANNKDSHLEQKKSRPKDIYGRPLPTEEDFEVLKNAPRLETGIAVRAKPFGVEIRNVKCLRCGTFGHQSGDRECPLKDVIMPNEENRLKRDDPLTAMMAYSATEPSKWELKQQPGGISPPRGGFDLDDPNQQIIPEDIFDEYGGFLNGGSAITELLTSYSEKNAKGSKSKHEKRKHKKSHKKSAQSKERHRRRSSEEKTEIDNGRKIKEKHGKRERKHYVSLSDSSDSTDSDRCFDERKTKSEKRKREMKHSHSLHSISENSDFDGSDDDRKVKHRNRKKKKKYYSSYSSSSEGSKSDQSNNKLKRKTKSRKKRKRHYHSSSSSESSDSERSDDRKRRKVSSHHARGSSSSTKHLHRRNGGTYKGCSP